MDGLKSEPIKNGGVIITSSILSQRHGSMSGCITGFNTVQGKGYGVIQEPKRDGLHFSKDKLPNRRKKWLLGVRFLEFNPPLKMAPTENNKLAGFTALWLKNLLLFIQLFRAHSASAVQNLM